MPAIRLHAETRKYTVSQDIVGKPFVKVKDDVTGNELEFLTGQVVYFTGEQETQYLSADPDQPKLFYVIASTLISLIPINNFDDRIPTGYFKKRPWDKTTVAIDPPAIKWDSESWDGSVFNIGTPEYVVMRRFTPDLNHWSVMDRWYHIGTIREVAKFLDLDIEDIARNDNQARRPIISFNLNLKFDY